MILLFCRPDKYADMSVDAKEELDLKIGMAFSRLMTRAYLDLAKEKFRIRDLKVISFGPCQTRTRARVRGERWQGDLETGARDAESRGEAVPDRGHHRPQRGEEGG